MPLFGSPLGFIPEPAVPVEEVTILPDSTFSTGRSFAGDVDWFRHLPTNVVPRLLSREQHDGLLDIFFKYFTICFTSGLRERFEMDMRRALKPQKRRSRVDVNRHYSAMLHNAILALATAYTDSEPLRDVKNRMEFARKAEEYIAREFERPTLSGVQAFAYLADFYLDLGQKVGFVQHSSICLRMIETSEFENASSFNPFADQVSKVRLKAGADRRFFESVQRGNVDSQDSIFWTTFIQDKLSSFYYGRICAITVNTRYFPIAHVEQSAEQTSGDLATQQIRLFLIANELKNSL